LDLDLFGQIRILERAMAVRGLILNTRSQIEIRAIANPLDLRTLILHLQMRYRLYSTVAFKLPIFKRIKGLANLSLGLSYGSMASSHPRFRDTIPLKKELMLLTNVNNYKTKYKITKILRSERRIQ
jgi:hypothetical protein